MQEVKARPFVKWAGGKRQLLGTFKDMFPSKLKDGKIQTYVEPFVGGGAVLFYILENYDIRRVVINDINKDLINCYRCIKGSVERVIRYLSKLEDGYFKSKDKGKYFYIVRDEYNGRKLRGDRDYRKCAQFIFLNKTCFNGLYRVNSKGEFNVPHGRHKKVVICDRENLRLCSQLLSGVEINCGNYTCVLGDVDRNTFLYLDPPYKPISTSSSFVKYNKEGFSDKDQILLSKAYRNLSHKGCLLMLSNSDPKNANEGDEFFDKLYRGFNIKRVFARRMINCQATKRGNITEIVVRNYRDVDN